MSTDHDRKRRLPRPNRAVADRLSSRNFAHDIEGELAFLGVPETSMMGSSRPTLRYSSRRVPTLRRRTGDGEDVRRFKWQELHGAVEIVPGMRSDDRLMVDIKVG